MVTKPLRHGVGRGGGKRRRRVSSGNFYFEEYFYLFFESRGSCILKDFILGIHFCNSFSPGRIEYSVVLSGTEQIGLGFG